MMGFQVKYFFTIAVLVGAGLFFTIKENIISTSPNAEFQALTPEYGAAHAPKSEPAELGRNDAISPLHKQIQDEALRLYSNVEDSAQEMVRLQAAAKNMTEPDLNQLEELALNISLDKDQRSVAAYYLRWAGPKAQSQLLKVFMSIPEISDSDTAREFEYSLRSMCLEGIEENIHASRGQLNLSKEILAQQSDRYLRGLLKIVITGQSSPKPLLKRFVESSLAQADL